MTDQPELSCPVCGCARPKTKQSDGHYRCDECTCGGDGKCRWHGAYPDEAKPVWWANS